MTRLGCAVGMGLSLIVSSPVSAQEIAARSWAVETSAAIGLGHVFRFEDRTYGNRVNAGGGVALVHVSGFALELAADRTLGLDPPATPCGLADRACIGSGHDGPTDAIVASLGVQYRFNRTRFQPYVTAGFGILWTRSLHSVTDARSNPAVISESPSSDRGFGPDLGAGLRVPLGRGISLNPELRWLDASIMSRENLAVTRLSLRLGYEW
jgi:hypothetical protein